MTLVEILIFMVLALSVLGSSLTLSAQISRMERSSEEILMAFLFNKSVAESLLTSNFNSITDGFAEAETGCYTKTNSTAEFLPHLFGKHVLILEKETNKDTGAYFKATSKLEWNSSATRTPESTYTIYLYENLGK